MSGGAVNIRDSNALGTAAASVSFTAALELQVDQGFERLERVDP